MRCLLCDGHFSESASWKSLLLLSIPPPACTDCLSDLKIIEGPSCPHCSRSMPEERVCGDCEKWNKNKAGTLAFNRSLYEYNEGMKAVLARYKFRGDAELVKLFTEDFKRTHRQSFSRCQAAVPIPLTEERLLERGFNQAELLAKLLPLPILHPLKRISSEKQSKKTRRQRLQNQNLFQLTSENDIRDKHLLLVDDIYTTGHTVRQAAKILLENGASSVSSLTLARG